MYLLTKLENIFYIHKIKLQYNKSFPFIKYNILVINELNFLHRMHNFPKRKLIVDMLGLCFQIRITYYNKIN